MTIPDDVREFTPGNYHQDGNPATLYWVRDQSVLFRGYPVRGAHIPSFRFYLGGFAKDHKHCYCTNSRLAGGNGATFRALNYTYATDGQFVWTIGGKIKDADATTFQVCDDGSHDLGCLGLRASYGFGKDAARVYYYDFDGKPNWVRKASSASFVSLNDGHYGKDDQHVFCGAVTLPKANVEHWRRIGGYYSKDDARVYYFNRPMRSADYDSFEVVPNNAIQLARDRHNFYRNDDIVSDADFVAIVAKYGQ